ncbi:MAG: hypothetical protein HYT87_07680 [Nitrospirae bacterium]|nr:hypothetical protein [Nitrospirota bacterium]
MRLLTRAPLFLCLFLTAYASSVFAWSRHDHITRLSLESVRELTDLPTATVTPLSESDPSLSPVYVPPYQAVPKPEGFQPADVTDTSPVGLIGEPLGGTITPRRILIEFSSEPDWGMDKGLKLDFAQKLQGGSQGYRHILYPAGTFHVPYAFLNQGEPPKRAKHFVEQAHRALARGDAYWFWRNMARALHYIQDVGQPYHTGQTSLDFLVKGDILAGTIEATTNYHLAYETFVANQLIAEIQGGVLRYTSALRGASSRKECKADRLVQDIASDNAPRGRRLMQLSVPFLGPAFKTGQKRRMTESEFLGLVGKTRKGAEDFDRETRAALQLTAETTRGFVACALETFYNRNGRP